MEPLGPQCARHGVRYTGSECQLCAVDERDELRARLAERDEEIARLTPWRTEAESWRVLYETARETGDMRLKLSQHVLAERERQLADAEMDVAALRTAIIVMGGTVEGKPTSRVNYLQRLRELLEKERRLTEAREAWERYWDAPRESDEGEAALGDLYRAIAEPEEKTDER